jgi:methionyl-tRNA formyltransferase
LVDWNWEARRIDAQIRAYTPWPLSWTFHGGRMLYILEASPCDEEKLGKPGKVLGADGKNGIMIQTGKGILSVRALQYEAKKALDWRPFLNGARNFIGSVLGTGGSDG